MATISFYPIFNAGIFLPILTIQWKGKNVVKFDKDALIPIYGYDYEIGPGGGSCSQGCSDSNLPFNGANCTYPDYPLATIINSMNVNPSPICVDQGTCTPVCTPPQVCLNDQCVNPVTCNPACTGSQVCLSNQNIQSSTKNCPYDPPYYNDYSTYCNFACQGIGFLQSDLDNKKISENVINYTGRCIIDPTKNFESFDLPTSNDGSKISNGYTQDLDGIYGKNYSWNLQFNKDITQQSGSVQMQLHLFGDPALFSLDGNNLPIITTTNIYTLLNVINGLKGSLPSTCIDFLGMNSYVYSITSLFYDSIYQFTDPTNNLYLQTNCLDSNFITNFTQSFSTNYTLPTFLSFPKPEQGQEKDSDNYYLTFSLSYQQIQNFLKKSPDPTRRNSRIEFMNTIASNFLKDKTGTNTINSNFIHLTDPLFEFADDVYDSTSLDLDGFGSYSYIYYKDNTFYPYQSFGQQPGTLYMPQQTHSPLNIYQYVSIQIKLKVKKWSVMLISYFEKFGNFTYTENVLSKISNDTGTIPFKYFKNTIDQITKYCPNMYTFTNDDELDNGLLSTLVVNSESPNTCTCYTSYLSPPAQGFPEDSAMCFDKSCSADILNIMGVSDSYCQSKATCQDVYNWTNATPGSSDASANTSELNKQKFNDYCSKFGFGIVQGKYNTSVLIFGGVFTILLTLFAYLICKNNNYESFKTFSICFIVSGLCSCGTYFLSLFLNGTMTCDGKTQICQSTYGKKSTIPLEFCKNSAVGCECMVDSDCSGKCSICSSGQCRSVDNKTYTIYQYNIKWITLIICFIMAIVFPLMFVYASEDYNWHLNKKMAIFFVLLLSFTPIIYSLVISLKKEKITKYSC